MNDRWVLAGPFRPVLTHRSWRDASRSGVVALSVDAFAGLGVEEVEVVGVDGDFDLVVGGMHPGAGLKRATALAMPSPSSCSGASGSPELTVLASYHEVDHQLRTERLDQLAGHASGDPPVPSVAMAASSKSSGRIPKMTR